MGSFCKNRTKFQLKKCRRLISHDTEEWCKISRKTDSCFQIWHEEFGEYSPNHSKVRKFLFNGLFYTKYMRFELKRGVIFHDTEQWCRIWINPDLMVSKMARGIEWAFIRAPKVWKLYKAYTVSVRKFQSNYVSWRWRVLQSLNENRLVAWKLT